jgi:hypothetical protein
LYLRWPARRQSANPLDNRYSAGEFFPVRGAVRPAEPHPRGGPGPDHYRPVPDEASIRRFLATSRYPAGAQLPPAARSPGARSPGARSPGARSPGARSPGIRFAGPGQPPASERSPAACSLAIRFPAAGQPRATPRPPAATPRPPTATPRHLAATTRPPAATIRPPASPAPAEAATRSPAVPVPPGAPSPFPAAFLSPAARSLAALPLPAPAASRATPAGRARVSPAGPRPRTRRGAGSSCHPSRALSFSLASAVVPAGACARLRPPPPPMAAVGPARTGAVDRAWCDIAVTGPLTSRYSPRFPRAWVNSGALRRTRTPQTAPGRRLRGLRGRIRTEA